MVPTTSAIDHFPVILLHEIRKRRNKIRFAASAAQLVLSGFGMYLGKKSERLQVKLAGKALYEFPFFRISEVVVASRGVSLSSDLLKEFCAFKIVIQPLCEKDVGSATYAYLFIDVPKMDERMEDEKTGSSSEKRRKAIIMGSAPQTEVT